VICHFINGDGTPHVYFANFFLNQKATCVLLELNYIFTRLARESFNGKKLQTLKPPDSSTILLHPFFFTHLLHYRTFIFFNHHSSSTFILLLHISEIFFSFLFDSSSPPFLLGRFVFCVYRSENGRSLFIFNCF